MTDNFSGLERASLKYSSPWLGPLGFQSLLTFCKISDSSVTSDAKFPNATLPNYMLHRETVISNAPKILIKSISSRETTKIRCKIIWNV